MLAKGGPANSGTKRPLRAKSPDWVCEQGHYNPGFALRCLTERCNERRDR